MFRGKFYYFQFWRLLGWAMIAAIIYFSLTASPPEAFEFSNADKLKHFLAYGVLMGWFAQLYPAGKSQWLWALVFCLLGVAMEFAQAWGGHRFFDVADMVANSLGVLLAWWLSRKWLAGSLLRVDHALSRWLGLK
ncbi:VanZ family protein [Beggiatoa alba]|nr:VanZ family protein [Beggiatoa alba]